MAAVKGGLADEKINSCSSVGLSKGLERKPERRNIIKLYADERQVEKRYHEFLRRLDLPRRAAGGKFAQAVVFPFFPLLPSWVGSRVARSTSPNTAHLKSHFAQKRTLLHKDRKKYRPKPKIWAFFAFSLTNCIAQRTKTSPEMLFWAMKSPIWPP